jgi:cytidyltransferase-like protein
MKFFDYLNEATKTTGKKKDLHLQHIEQIAAETGDIEFIKKIFNSILGEIDEDFSAIITEKVDGVPVLFGKTHKDGFFVSLKNRSFPKGKFNKTAAFFNINEIKNIGENEYILKNMWNLFKDKVEDDTIYFGELLFSNYQNEDENIDIKQTIEDENNNIFVQSNLIYYKIKGITKTQKLGLLEIQKAKNINDIEQLSSIDFIDQSWGIPSNKDLFITDGKIKLDNKDKIKDLKLKIQKLDEITIDKNFKIRDYLFNQKQSKITEIKEEILNAIQEKKNILGFKGIDSKESVDEGLVIKGKYNQNDFMVKLISKDFFIYSQKHHNKLEPINSITESSELKGKTLEQFKIIFPGKFQPFHNGHLETFKNLEKEFGEGNVIIVTSEINKSDSKKLLPLNFEDKKTMMIKSGIPESAIKNRGSLQMYSQKMAKEFIDTMKYITVYAVGDKEEDKDRLKKDGKTKKIIINSNNDFKKAKEMVQQSLNAEWEEKIFYTFITNPPAIKSDNEDVKAGNIREKLAAGEDISSLVPYDTKDVEIQKILNKFTNNIPVNDKSKKKKVVDNNMTKWTHKLSNIINEFFIIKNNSKSVPIFEGGNTTFIVGTKTYSVSKIDFVKTKQSFPNFKKHLLQFLNKLSIKFGKKYGRTIWPEGKAYFSGSSEVVLNEVESYVKDKNNRKTLIDNLFSKEELKSIDKQLLEDETEFVYRWLKKYKPTAGDVDVQVSEDKDFFKNLTEFLYSISILGVQEPSMDEDIFLNKLKKECPMVGDICIIDNKPIAGQVISAVAIRQNQEAKSIDDFLFFQCDWEAVETDESGIPTEFAKFSRSSSIKDIEKGIKGREHKYLLRVLANIASNAKADDIKLLSYKTLKPVKSTEGGFYSFSVKDGLRKKFWDPNDPTEKELINNYFIQRALLMKKPKDDDEKEEIINKAKETIENALNGKSETPNVKQNEKQNKNEKQKSLEYIKNIRVQIPDDEKIYIKDIGDIKEKLGIKKIQNLNSFIALSDEIANTFKNKAEGIIDLFKSRLIQQLTVAPNTIKGNYTLDEKIDKAFEEDYNTKIVALRYLAKKFGKSISDDEIKAMFEVWKEKERPKLLKKAGKLSEEDTKLS